MSTVLFKTMFGSHMYGLNTPSSDMDYKSVSVPCMRDILLHGPVTHKVTSTGQDHSKNTSEDVDHEDMSLVKFVQLASRGEMIALDMLHSPKEFWLESSPEWEYLYSKRELFYTSQMDAYLGYLRRQTSKYGLKGSRLYALQEAIKSLAQYTDRTRLGDVAGYLFTDEENALLVSSTDKTGRQWKYYEVLGSKYQYQDSVGPVLDSLNAKLEKYGGRAKLAAQNEGVDWKAVHHAMRAALQLRDLYTKGKMVLPFIGMDKSILLQIKRGEIPWSVCSDMLSNMTESVQALARQSNFPVEVDRKKVEDLVLECYCMMGYCNTTTQMRNP